MNTNNRSQQRGFSLVELMIATGLGLVITYAALQIYLTQSQVYKTSNSQALILSAENAIINLMAPTLRSAGFLGCGAALNALSNLNPGAPGPLGTFNTTPALIAGYNGSGASFVISQTNPANSNTASHWTPSLPPSLVGLAQQGSDIVIVIGATTGSTPLGVTQIDAGSSSLGVLSTANSNLVAGQLAAVSDCVKSIIFQVTSVGANSITHAAGGGVFNNASSTFPITFPVGSQLIPVQETAFFIGQGQGGESTLMRGILAGATWTVEPLVPGVELMKIQYGIGDNGQVSRYVAANGVTDWTRVYALRIGFLLAGKAGSSSSQTTYTVLDTNVTVPADSLLRHTYEMTIQLRNAL